LAKKVDSILFIVSLTVIVTTPFVLFGKTIFFNKYSHLDNCGCQKR
jgi:hypothetical protein